MTKNRTIESKRRSEENTSRKKAGKNSKLNDYVKGNALG
jgi:hypothetical protein